MILKMYFNLVLFNKFRQNIEDAKDTVIFETLVFNFV